MRFEHLQNQTLCTCAQHSSSSNRSPRSLFWTCFYPKLVHKVVLYYSKYSSVVGILLLWTPDPLRNRNVFFFKKPKSYTFFGLHNNRYILQYRYQQQCTLYREAHYRFPHHKRRVDFGGIPGHFLRIKMRHYGLIWGIFNKALLPITFIWFKSWVAFFPTK